MSKMKRAVAIALAAAMTMGSTLTVFAADTGSGGTTGKGENEGHVDQELINVVLPTVPTGEGSPFEYVTDPERLIQATKGARYEDYTFPDSTSDTGVYFRTGEKTFSNTSETLKVINKSSCDMTITLTAKATATGSGKDLALATTDTVDGTTPLYLALKVGASTTQAISTTEASVPKTISGTPGNFEIQYTGSGYEYVTKADAAHWRALEFSLTGKVYNGTVADGTTAPTVEVTWTFAKATGAADTGDEVDHEETAEPEILSISNFIKADPKNVVIKFFLGKGADAVDADGVILYTTVNRNPASTAKYSVDMDKGTVTIDPTAGFMLNATADFPVYLVLTKGGSEVKELEGMIKVKADYTSAEIISVTDYDRANPQNVVITFSLGDGPKAVDADGVVLYTTANRNPASTTKYSVDMTKGTVTIDPTAGFITNATGDIPIVVALTKDGTEVKELTGTIKVK